jgi:protein-disulfide isomerase
MRRVAEQLTLGRDDTSYLLYEYADLQCPDSRYYSQYLFPYVKRDFIDTGRVRYVFRAMPLEVHPQAMQAEIAARCAGEQGNYLEMRQRLMAQTDLGSESIRQQAEALGLNSTRVSSCMKSTRHQTEINKEKADAERIGVAATPTLILVHISPDGQMRTVYTASEPKDYSRLKRGLERAMGIRRFLWF